jgi:hypothetical protein
LSKFCGERGVTVAPSTTIWRFRLLPLEEYTVKFVEVEHDLAIIVGNPIGLSWTTGRTQCKWTRSTTSIPFDAITTYLFKDVIYMAFVVFTDVSLKHFVWAVFVVHSLP